MLVQTRQNWIDTSPVRGHVLRSGKSSGRKLPGEPSIHSVRIEARCLNKFMILRLISQGRGVRDDRVCLHCLEIDAFLGGARFDQFQGLLKNLLQILPELGVMQIEAGRIVARIFECGVHEACGGHRATLAPAIAVIVNARDETRVFSKIKQLLFFQRDLLGKMLRLIIDTTRFPCLAIPSYYSR